MYRKELHGSLDAANLYAVISFHEEKDFFHEEKYFSSRK